MRRLEWAIVVLALGCAKPAQTGKEAQCAEGTGIARAECWQAAYDEAYTRGLESGAQGGYDDGYEACEASYPDTADTGETAN